MIKIVLYVEVRQWDETFSNCYFYIEDIFFEIFYYILLKK